MGRRPKRGWRGQKQRRERIPNLDTTCAAVSVPRKTLPDASSPQAGISWDFLQELQGFQPVVAFLVKTNYLELLNPPMILEELFKNHALQQDRVFSKLVELNCLMMDTN